MNIKDIFCGDNLIILSQIPSESVDLIYLDPPSINHFYHKHNINNKNQNDTLQNYIDWLMFRVVECQRVLKITGTIYFQCSSDIDSYIRILLDKVFGYNNYVSKVIWQKNVLPINDSKKTFMNDYDSIIVFSKSHEYTLNSVHAENELRYIEHKYKFTEEETGRIFALEDLSSTIKDRPNTYYEFLGVTRNWRYPKDKMNQLLKDGRIYQKETGHVPYQKRYLDERRGKMLGDVWTDISARPSSSDSLSKRYKYESQKPIALLERIIKASSNQGDLILDPFSF